MHVGSDAAAILQDSHAHLARHVQFGVAEDKMMERLWGDNFFDPKTKKWTKKHTGTDTCQWVPSLLLYGHLLL